VAAQTVDRWSGRALDPQIVEVFLDSSVEPLRISSPDDVWARAWLQNRCRTMGFATTRRWTRRWPGSGDAADLEAPWFHGHSSGVARLARAAAERMPAVDAVLVYRAGLVHDLGRDLGAARAVAAGGLGARAGALLPFGAGSFSRSPVLAPLGSVVTRHHERVDGSGYPAGVRASELDAAACVLAAADVFHALCEVRPHRAALDPAAAFRVLSGLPLDRDAISAVLDAARAPRPALPKLPADLTARELDVLRRLVAGRTKREITAELVISHSTVHIHTPCTSTPSAASRPGPAWRCLLCGTGWRPAQADPDSQTAGRGAVRGPGSPSVLTGFDVRYRLNNRCVRRERLPMVARTATRKALEPQEPAMSTQTDTPSATSASDPAADIAVIQAGFGALALGDLAGFGDMFHPDATWNHRNDDWHGGIHRGSDGIVAFIAASAQRTAGTLRPVPQRMMADGAGRVCMVVQVSASRPDGRTFDDTQILLFAVDGGQVRSVDQFVGDPSAVKVFWA
jgi:ketosteroid isomerase-like protein